MDYDQEDDNEGGLMARIKESPRTVSALIIILIIAAAIYAFSGDEGEQAPEVTETDSATVTTEEGSEATADEDVDSEDGEEVATEVVDEAATTPVEVDAEVLNEEKQQLPEATKTDDGYVEVASAGNGMTHLARRATTRYLSENNVGYAVTNEHRIYMEDYIKDRIGATPLALGATQAISFDLIREAAEAAGRLNERQLKNLTQYTYVLS